MVIKAMGLVKIILSGLLSTGYRYWLFLLVIGQFLSHFLLFQIRLVQIRPALIRSAFRRVHY